MENIMAKNDIEYKYNEKENLDDILEYVNKTYSQHYSKNKYQTFLSENK